MSDIQITNCHIHTFTHRHVPLDYPYSILRPFRKTPWLIRSLAWLAEVLGREQLGQKLRRLHAFQIEANAEKQRDIFCNVRRHYPANTRFVVLPMEMSGFGYGDPRIPLSEQHDELGELSRDPEFHGLVLPFGTLDPRVDPEAEELWRAVDKWGFRGVKIYPRLGFAPDDPILREKVYPEMVKRNLPLMTHCSRGGVQGKELPDYTADRYTDPAAYVGVMRKFRELRICLAHFGGLKDWEAYVNRGSGSSTGDPNEENWQVDIRRMISCGDFPNLWTDISYTLFHFEDYIPFLRLFLAGNDEGSRRLRHRVLFGSDFYMTRQEELSERAVCFRLRNALGEELFRQIAEKNPKVWLGEVPDPLAAAAPSPIS